MDVNATNNATGGLAILNRANDQPKLAIEVLEKSIEGTSQLKVDESAQSEMAAFTGKGQRINITA
ncbi:hypothetical protein [Desulfuromonas acetoxidans]|uniref:hypothetical protein n=1 Tax=Desulfuromonas acetoxidans TaxID=891 RepID=UPI0002DACF54|nr:hypothetical protein [Desulfuromonas acetoxidans]MBF0645575.1 hypothetical protein [Desulfuromonas acetoxidans]NVD23377.1 hypothetical protein [Desulfuromonas acetoxidans]NVE15382.1 hypothetical protein [Desulfuromonas acetoxidans]